MLVAVLLVVVVSAMSGCATPEAFVERWRTRFQSPPEPIPLPAIGLSLDALEDDLQRTVFEDYERASLVRLSQLAGIFYQRLAHRRVNSIATFNDPALREFFRTDEAFADYYADLVQRLDIEHFEANRPNEIDLVSMHVEETADRVVAVIEFRGDNSLPLRFWSVGYSRRDVWERSEDRWWIIPGKL